ncbi:MAG: hypothetical protein A3J37_09155 [Alphaproteobacteria bacterium RIFCSPHIGHO2_12_FULL_45_9]|nr:MAG: hypothetical protein A3B66_03270 [Alphaproteobacteria bacterium RIFCSPHIGHO2_02_FULL_46_13]OFW93674.1 MAG: hypothetical protein A3J37_09155 [Alphaproteobacteria bacterium RIFCSPHIGHO2_12_FULL_45_9]
MKRSLVGLMAGLAIGTATQANAADPPLVDKVAGTILKNISTDKGDASIKELLSCKYAYIAVTQGQSIHTINLSVSTDSSLGNIMVKARLETARAECKKYGLEANF